MSVQEKIKGQVNGHKVVLYMKGVPAAPMCGFSARAAQILQLSGVEESDLLAVNILEDPEVRQGIKEFSNWPTIPQLYVNGEFLGGSDVMLEMYESGELAETLK